MLGVILALLSGIANNIGMILQKKVVNKYSSKEKFFKNLIKNPLWCFGLILQLFIGAIFFMIAQMFIGPSMIPGLMAVGLIILALGSIKILGEKLNKLEIFGIILMIIAITLIGLSGVEINIENINIIEINLLIRITLFTLFFTIISLILFIFQKKKFYPGISAAINSGIMFSLSNFWIFPLMATITQIFLLNVLLDELIIFIIASIILILTNIFGIAKIQEAFKFGQASNLIPIQQIPVQISSPSYYILIYAKLPNIQSLFLIWAGVILVIISSFILGKRQAKLEKIS